MPVVFITISWQEARLSCDGKEQELSSISIFPSKLFVKLFCFLPPIFTFLAEGCTLPAALSDERKHLVVMFQIREQAVKAQSLCLQVTWIKYQFPRMLFSFRWQVLSDRKKSFLYQF